MMVSRLEKALPLGKILVVLKNVLFRTSGSCYVSYVNITESGTFLVRILQNGVKITHIKTR